MGSNTHSEHPNYKSIDFIKEMCNNSTDNFVKVHNFFYAIFEGRLFKRY